MKINFAALILIIILNTANSAHITVGADSCDETTIQAAINTAGISPSITEIRVATNRTYNESVIINSQSLIIRGGYVDCASAIIENPANRVGKTRITGVASAGVPVIRITGQISENNIVLDSLEITGGTASLGNDNSGGGIAIYDSWSFTEIINSHIFNNTGSIGGGLSILDNVTGFSRVILTDSSIFSNTALSGGGIYCTQQLSDITMSGASGIFLNTAYFGKGGGAYMTNGCDLTVYSGTDGNNGLFDFKGVMANSSTSQGGGIFANEASQVTLYGHESCASASCVGDNINPVSLTSNHSETDGGGAYISGINTRLTIYAGLVQGNTADGDGGAVYVNNKAEFLVERLSSECWDTEQCNYFYNNKAGVSSGKGGVVYNRFGTVNMSHTVVENNRADFGTVIAAEGSPIITPTTTTIKSSIIHRNGNNGANSYADNYVFSILSGAKIDVSHSTIADNNVNSAIFNISSASVGDSDLFASIVDDQLSVPVFANNQTSNIFVSCMILHETNSIPNSQLNTTEDDANFVDRANGNYHLNPNSSPAIDYCNDILGPSNYKDIDFEDYGVDHPSVNNLFGSYDIGADEVHPLLTLTVSTTGNGNVISDPSGIDCGTTNNFCTNDFLLNTQVTLTATPAFGNSFDSWTGACTGSPQICNITMDQANATTAVFTPDFFLLTAIVNGNGTVSSNPVGIDCGSDCIQAYTPNTLVALTATPDLDHEFVEWSLGCTGTSTSACNVLMDAGKTVRALFVAIPTTYTLTTTVLGNGTITSNPVGINCGVDCTQDYTVNTSVSLTAIPQAGFSFTGWSGNCTGTGSCVVNMAQARNVTATFSAIQFTLNTNVIGNGTITSNPVGINCGVDCTQDYTVNTSVSLTATPQAGFSFTGWSGDCTGTGSCVVNMTQAREVDAIFNISDDDIFKNGFEMNSVVK